MDAKRKKPWVKPELRQIEPTPELLKKFFPELDAGKDFEGDLHPALRRALRR